MSKVSIIGAGRLGGSLAIGLSEAGFVIDSLVTREGLVDPEILSRLPENTVAAAFDSLQDLSSDVLVIAVQDSRIEAVAQGLVSKLAGRPAVLHTAGSLSSEILAPLAEAGCETGSMHPLVSLSSPVLGPDRFRGGFFCLEGTAGAVRAAGVIVDALGGFSFSIETGRKSLYHAAAVMACGHVVALLDTAFELLSECGIGRDEAKRALLPLVEGTLGNLRSQEPAEALTGPFARTDVETVARNLDAVLGTGRTDSAETFAVLGERSLELARSRGADGRKSDAIAELLRLVKQKP